MTLQPQEVVLRYTALLMSLFVLACAPEDAEETTPPPPYDPMPAWDALASDTWTEINPGWNTLCSRGQPWGFFVRPGDPQKVVVEFQGGGACWNFGTCSVADAIFKDNIDDVRSAVLSGTFSGIYDQDNDENPFKGWTHVFVPYCTGDIHWGDADVVYEEAGVEPFNLSHMGANNTRAALYWLGEQGVVEPEKIFVTGCSAGSYGSVGWAPYLMQQYPAAKVIQMGDCGAGVITDSFLSDSFPIWEARKMLPEWIPALHPDTVDLSTMALYDLYREIGNHHSEHLMSQYNTIYDSTQVTYFRYMGASEEGDPRENWRAGMLDSIKQIADTTDNFRYYIAEGDDHCILHRDSFYSVNEDGTSLVDWINSMINDETVTNPTCENCDPVLKD